MKHLKLTIAAAIAALTLAAVCVAHTGLPGTAASADHNDDNDHGKTKLSFDVSLLAPGLCDPAFGELAIWQGTVGWEIRGTVRARLQGMPLMIGGDTVPVKLNWVVSAGANSFTVPLEGTWNIKTGKLEMAGTVTEGFRTGERARLQAKLFDLRNLRFKGEMRVGGFTD